MRFRFTKDMPSVAICGLQPGQSAYLPGQGQYYGALLMCVEARNGEVMIVHISENPDRPEIGMWFQRDAGDTQAKLLPPGTRIEVTL